MSKRTAVERNIYLTHGGRYLVRIRSKDTTKIYGNFYELEVILRGLLRKK